jgi:hypothetical protein
LKYVSYLLKVLSECKGAIEELPGNGIETFKSAVISAHRQDTIGDRGASWKRD